MSERGRLSERVSEGEDDRMERLCVLYILYIPSGGRGTGENSLTDGD